MLFPAVLPELHFPYAEEWESKGSFCQSVPPTGSLTLSFLGIEIHFPGNDWKTSPLLEVFSRSDTQKVMGLLGRETVGSLWAGSVAVPNISLVFQRSDVLGTWDTQLFKGFLKTCCVTVIFFLVSVFLSLTYKKQGFSRNTCRFLTFQVAVLTCFWG